MASFVFHSIISWDTNLGVVKTSTREDTVDVPVLTAETDTNAAYEEAIHVLSTKPPKEEKGVDATTAQEDYYCDFGTKCSASPSFLSLLIVFFFLM